MTHQTIPHLAASPEPLMVTEAEACRMLRLGRTTLFHLRRSGQIKSVLVKTHRGNISGRRMYPLESLRAYVADLQAQDQHTGEADLDSTDTTSKTL